MTIEHLIKSFNELTSKIELIRKDLKQKTKEKSKIMNEILEYYKNREEPKKLIDFGDPPSPPCTPKPPRKKKVNINSGSE